MRTIATVFLCLSLLASGCAGPRPPQVEAGRLSRQGSLPVLHLSGSPYQIGYQHGTLMREQVRESTGNIMRFVDDEVGIPVVGGWLARRVLDRAWSKMAPHVPRPYLEELRGLSAGSGVPLRTLQRIHALPELMSTMCASFAAFGNATRGGRLIQIRNLDWAIQSDVQRYSAIFVIHPQGKRPFVSVGWLGFIGVISGMNGSGISVGQIGSETVDYSLEGVPMPFLLRRVLEESSRLDDAVALVRRSPRTNGFNYLFADAKARRAVVLETTRRHCAVFWADQEPQQSPHGVFVRNAIFRGDWSLDPAVRDVQTASKGNPRQPGLESPEGSRAYDVRYRGQGLLLKEMHGRVDPETAMSIARSIAPKSNIQSIVYAFPQMWIAIAEGKRPAAEGTYFAVDVQELLGG